MNSKLPQHSPESPVGSIREQLLESTSIACANCIASVLDLSSLQLSEDVREQLKATTKLVVKESLRVHISFEMERVRMMASCMAFN